LAVLPGTRAQIASRTGLSREGLRKRLRILRDEKQVFIGGWERLPDGEFGCHWIPVYHAGPGPDVPCRFRRKTPEQNYAAFVRRARESGALDTIMAKKRARYWKIKAQQQRDPLVAALFGPAKKR
jgi:hypothetical protein